jgi:hypothetical protein
VLGITNGDKRLMHLAGFDEVCLQVSAVQTAAERYIQQPLSICQLFAAHPPLLLLLLLLLLLCHTVLQASAVA